MCGTDVHLWHGRLSGVPYPIIPGHVSAGTLEAIRGRLRAIDGEMLREGDRVVFFDVHRTCGHCRACTVHRTPTRCAARRVYGITDPAAEGLFGGWSQGIYLEPGVGVARLPDAVGFDDYIGGGCGLLTAVHIIERAALAAGESIVVQGTGAVGLSTIALARLAGAATIIAIGAPAARLDLARAMGADQVYDLNGTVTGRAPGGGAVAHVRRGRRRGRRSRRVREGLRGRAGAGAGRWPIRRRRPLHRRGKQPGERASRTSTESISRSAAAGEARPAISCRRVTLLERHAAAVPWRLIGERCYSLHQLNEALADAESMRITKALVDPWRPDRWRVSQCT